MKVGSLVVCPNGVKVENEIAIERGYKLIGIPASNEIIYTVRACFKSLCNSDGVLLEEITNPIHPTTKREFGYMAESFREIQPPMDLTELLEETKVLELVNQE